MHFRRLFLPIVAATAGPALASSALASPPAAVANPKLADLPVNTWQKIAGFAPSPKGILAYSGGCFDPLHGQFLIFGGGHADYSGNEVCAFSPATLTWQKMYEPDAKERYTNDNIDNLHGRLKDSDRPYTRHTYNQLCWVNSLESMFIFGGCGPGWSGVKPNCPTPPDCWAYSYANNHWTSLYAGPDSPVGYARACCYDSKRDTVWAFSGDDSLHQFDLKTKSWSTHPVTAKLDKLGTYNFQMAYLPKADRVLLLGKSACTVDPETFAAEEHSFEKCSGKGGVAYLPDQNAELYVTLPGEGLDYRMLVFDCAKNQWHEWQAEGKPASEGVLWDRLQYDPANHLALLVSADGVWAWKPPVAFGF